MKPDVLTERELSQQVFDLAVLTGWRVVRFPAWRPTSTTPGFPDIVAVRGGRLLFAELKTETGKLTPAQREWLWLLAEAGGVDVYVWRPSNWRQAVQVLR